MREELENLRIEIIATDYAYMPDRDGRTYRFDVSDDIGNLHHKWNLVSEEISFTKNAPTPIATAPVETRQAVNKQADRAASWGVWADRGLVPHLLGRFFSLAPQVDTAGGNWRRHYFTVAAKHRYHLNETPWRVVEIRDDGTGEVVNRGTHKRLIRFETGDMTMRLPRGYEEGNSFDLSVVTSVIPYIYGYYRTLGEEELTRLQQSSHDGKRLTPMEQAQDILTRGSRRGAWIIVDPGTEHEALAAVGKLQPMDSNYENWSAAWRDWLDNSRASRDISLLVTHKTGMVKARSTRDSREP